MCANDRIIEQDEISRPVTMAIMLYSIPVEYFLQTEALVVFPGLGESWRVIDAIDRFQTNNCQAQYLLIAGHNNNEDHYQDLSLTKLRKPPFNLSKDGKVIAASHANNTKEQCQ